MFSFVFCAFTMHLVFVLDQNASRVGRANYAGRDEKAALSFVITAAETESRPHRFSNVLTDAAVCYSTCPSRALGCTALAEGRPALDTAE